MDEAKGKVVLFGKTGDGKSTVANVLVTGGIEDLRFPIGHGVKGCTTAMQTLEGRGWVVTDTVGLGEGKHGQVKDAEEMILDFLKKVRGQYTHVIYVKSAGNRFDMLDGIIWESFKRIFRGAEEAFTVLFTKGTAGGEFKEEQWLDKNWETLPEWVKELGRANVLITDIPPISERKVLESRNQVARGECIEKLERDLLKALQNRGGRYSTPGICTMSDPDLVAESKSILEYIQEMLSTLLQTLNTALKIMYSVERMIASLKPMFE